MPEQVPYKIYKQQSGGKDLYDILPGYNTPSGYSEVNDPGEIQTGIADYQNRVIVGAAGA